jgi:hypothetical protein
VRLLLQAASVEAGATGLVLIVVPALFAWLVFGGEFSATGIALARLAGIALLTIGFMCWPSSGATTQNAAIVRALVIYNCLAMIYLAYVGLGPKLTGLLLWPAVALHAVFAVLFIRTVIAPPGADGG